MKRIVFCLNGPNHLNGPNVWLTRHIPLLKQMGMQPEVLYLAWNPETPCSYRSYFEERGVNVTCVQQRGFLETKVDAILAALCGDMPDYFVPNYSVPAYFASRFLREAGVITIGTLHSDDPYYHDIMDVFVCGAPEWRLSAVVGVSDLISSWVEKQGMAVPYLYATYGAPIPDVQATYETTPLKLIYSGRLTDYQKRIRRVMERLLDATSLLENTEATIYGTGAEEDALKLLLQESETGHVRLGGSLPSAEMKQAMLNSHVFVLLSDFEGLSIALMEAMACGLVPIVSNMRSGVRDVIVHGENGFIVDPDSKEDFIAAVRILRDHPKTWKLMSDLARTTIIERELTPESCATRWVSFLSEQKPDKILADKQDSAFCVPPFCDWHLPQVSSRDGGIGERKRMIHVLRVVGNRPIYLWGCGSYGEYTIDALKRQNVPIEGFIDSSPEKHGMVISGLKVFSPELLCSREARPFVVLATSFYREVIQVLDARGFQEFVDYV